MTLARLVSIVCWKVRGIIQSPKLHIVIERASHEADDMPNVWDSGCYYRWLSRLRHSGILEGQRVPRKCNYRARVL